MGEEAGENAIDKQTVWNHCYHHHLLVLSTGADCGYLLTYSPMLCFCYGFKQMMVSPLFVLHHKNPLCLPVSCALSHNVHWALECLQCYALQRDIETVSSEQKQVKVFFVLCERCCEYVACTYTIFCSRREVGFFLPLRLVWEGCFECVHVFIHQVKEIQKPLATLKICDVDSFLPVLFWKSEYWFQRWLNLFITAMIYRCKCCVHFGFWLL